MHIFVPCKVNNIAMNTICPFLSAIFNNVSLPSSLSVAVVSISIIVHIKDINKVQMSPKIKRTNMGLFS